MLRKDRSNSKLHLLRPPSPPLRSPPIAGHLLETCLEGVGASAVGSVRDGVGLGGGVGESYTTPK